ncbi:MAG: efflux RND transporter periplasmic adaptor subunit [Verrucomicrobiota bacterium]
MKNKLPWILIGVALAAGFLIRGFLSPSPPLPRTPSSTETATKFWTCSMHPQVQHPEPGKCPICFMDLIPVSENAPDGSGHAHELHLTEHARKLAEVETSVVERRFVETEVRLTGKIEYDETRLSTITARVPGRLDRLYVDYTGMPVRKGDPLVELYSPELLAAQQELIQAGANESLQKIARDKLLLYGLAPQQLAELEKRKTPNDQLTIHSPTAGVVVQKTGIEGMYVQTGSPIYTVADLSHVWIVLDAYESDLDLLQHDQSVAVSTEAFPGETFKGSVAFIDPIIDEATRTAKVRVNMSNTDGRLKPGMFVRAVVQAQIGGETPPLVIPASSALLTGKRAIVYLETQEGVYLPRQIRLGRRAGDFRLVESGLEEGDTIVSKGAFKIDSEIQIQAKPGMMSVEGKGHMEMKPQMLCPVMGNPINKEVYADYQGQRVYFCCAGCDSTFMEDPEKHLEQMRAEGVEPEKVESKSHEH